MQAYCDPCGKSFFWRARKGTRLADLRCPDCKGALHGPRPRQTAASNKGKAFCRCAACGSRRRTDRVKPVERVMHLPALPPYPLEIEAGAVICRWHDLREGPAADCSTYDAGDVLGCRCSMVEAPDWWPPTPGTEPQQ